MKLQARLALTVALAAAIAILVMASAFWVLSARQQRGAIDDSLLRAVNQPREVLEDVGAGRQRPEDNRPGRGDRPGGGLGGLFADDTSADSRLFSRSRLTVDGEVVVDQGLPAVEFSPSDGASISTIEIDGERYRMAVAGIGQNGDRGVLQLARNIEDSEGGLSTLRRQILLGSIAGIALAGLLGALVARRLSAPITEVATAARALALRRDLPSRINVNRSDEVGDLANSFNDMLAALELSREQQHRLVADASHELRTPLTSLRLKVDLLDSNPNLPEVQRQELLSSSAAEVEQLSDLVSELVDLATDPTGIEEKPMLQSLPRLVSEVAEGLELRTSRPVSVVAAENQPDVWVRHRMVRRAVSNLIDNALKYSPPGSPVTVRVDGGRIEVRDAGEGIPAEDLGYVFDRFFRSPTARTRPGNGIGLAIVSRVADVHGGEVWADNATDPSGAVVGFSVNGLPPERENEPGTQ